MVQNLNIDKRLRCALSNGEHLFVDTEGKERQWRTNGILGYGGSGIVYDAVNPMFPAKHYALKEYLPLCYCDYVKRCGEELQVDEDMLPRWLDGSTQFLKELGIQKELPGSNTEDGCLFQYAVDSFCANGTAYVVLDTDNCVTLEEYVAMLHCLIESNGCGDCSALVSVIQCLVDVCDAVSLLHSIGYLHLDISDTNILVNRKTDTARLNDFASCLSYDKKANAVLSENCIFYTVQFSPIEQKLAVAGKRNAVLSPATDVYSICAVLYKCLFQHPYDASLPFLVEGAEEIPLCPILGSEQTREITDILKNGLCGHNYRIQTAQELKENLVKVLCSVEQLSEKQRGVQLGLLPSVSLAVGYYENFLQDCCFALSKMKTITLDGKTFRTAKMKKELRVLVPENVQAEWKAIADEVYRRPELSLYSLDGRRGFGVAIDTSALEKGWLRVVDVPLTLCSAFKTIEFLTEEGVCAKEDAAHLKEQERQSFIAAITKRAEKHPIVRSVLRIDKL